MNPVADLASVLRLRSIFAAERPDLVFAYTMKPVIYSHLAARLVGRNQPRVVGLISGLGYAFGRDTAKQRVTGVLVRRLLKTALKKSSAVFFQNPDDEREFLAGRLLHRKTPRFVVNGSGVDLSAFQPARLPDTPVFLMLARLLRDKGVFEYIEAAKTVRAKVPEARFLLAGALDPNPMSLGQDELLEICSKGVVEFLGELDDVRPALAEARVYVLPSYREGTPRSILEAMAMGRPIITTDAPGCRETVVHGKNGLLVPPKNSQALAAAMEQLISEPSLALKMGGASLELARDKYDVLKVNEQMFATMGL